VTEVAKEGRTVLLVDRVADELKDPTQNEEAQRQREGKSRRARGPGGNRPGHQIGRREKREENRGRGGVEEKRRERRRRDDDLGRRPGARDADARVEAFFAKFLKKG